MLQRWEHINDEKIWFDICSSAFNCYNNLMACNSSNLQEHANIRYFTYHCIFIGSYVLINAVIKVIILQATSGK